MAYVSVIIPAHNAADTIGWTLAGLEEQDFAGDFEVIVVDDGSSDTTADIARDSHLGVRLVRLEGVGAAQARNAGANAGSERLAFLDSDCRPSPAWLRIGMAALEGADLVQGATYPDPESVVRPFDRTLWVRPPSALFESANLLVRRELFAALGGFESGIGPARGRPMGEDVSFGWRAHRSGARISFCDKAVVYHAVFDRSLIGYLAERRRLRFFPSLVRRVPELRDHFFYRRLFLTRRSAAFDVAFGGCAAALRWRRPIPLALAIPYVVVIGHRLRGGGLRHAVKMLGAEGAADAIGLVALLQGSVCARRLVL